MTGPTRAKEEEKSLLPWAGALSRDLPWEPPLNILHPHSDIILNVLVLWCSSPFSWPAHTHPFGGVSFFFHQSTACLSLFTQLNLVPPGIPSLACTRNPPSLVNSHLAFSSWNGTPMRAGAFIHCSIGTPYLLAHSSYSINTCYGTTYSLTFDFHYHPIILRVSPNKSRDVYTEDDVRRSKKVASHLPAETSVLGPSSWTCRLQNCREISRHRPTPASPFLLQPSRFCWSLKKYLPCLDTGLSHF